MSRAVLGALTLLSVAASLAAQHPLQNAADAVEVRYATSQPVVTYTLRVDSSDLSGYDVTIRIRNAPDTLHLAMATHPEYDDRFWRYVERLEVETPHGAAQVAREDSALWRVVAPGGEGVVRYRIHLPPAEGRLRRAWVPFLAPQGGLVGGMQSFMYVVGATLVPSYVILVLPPTWHVATGLERSAIDSIYFAASVDVLLDSPILVGHFRDWRFAEDGVPHRIVYLPLPDPKPFDTTALVGGIEQIVRQAIDLFGRAPYRDYTFLIQDGAFGALEHANSVTLGAPSDELAQGLTDQQGEAAHEYFHTWNLVRIRPDGFGGVDYRPARRSRGLWWGEGITMFYADVLRRRAGLKDSDSTRSAHLEHLIARYLGSPGNSRFSPESVSVVTNGTPPGALGDYSASVHLQGELLGTMLDLMVRDATQGRRSLDDVMRAMMARYSGAHGYTGADIEAAVAGVCGCAVHAFFERYVRSAHSIDFDRYLGLAGLRTAVTWGPGVGPDGASMADLPVFAWLPPGASALRLLVTDPASAWGRAGLHTGDQLVSVNGAPLVATDAFRTLIRGLRIGDTVAVEVRRAGGPFRATVVVNLLVRPTVRIEELPAATERQRTLRTRWLAATP